MFSFVPSIGHYTKDSVPDTDTGNICHFGCRSHIHCLPLLQTLHLVSQKLKLIHSYKKTQFKIYEEQWSRIKNWVKSKVPIYML